MKKFTCVQDIGDLKSALAEAFEIKKDRFKYVELGRNKTLMMISSSPIGPRACSFCVLIPISAPNPNCAPSLKETGKREEIETIPLSLKIKQGIERN